MDCGEMGLTRRLRSEPYGSLEPTLIGLMTIKMAGRGLCFLAALVVGANSAGASCTDSDGSCTEWVAMDTSYSVLVHRTHGLNDYNSEVSRAVLVVHGTNANADDYFSRIVRAADDHGVTSESLIVAPRFRFSAESAQSGELYWLDGSSSGHSWKQGDPSNTPGTAVSSFEVMDHLLSMVTDRARFPNLRVITLIGHSAGGQYVQRYAAGTQAPASFAEHRFVFVVANPSSYLYLNGQRPEPGSTTEFAVPSTNCAYDLYRYGLRNRNAYMSALNQTAIRDQYIERFVTYLAGEEDNDANDPTLNMTCAANVQGPHRLARASAYANHVDRFYPSNIHQFVLVPGVGHSSTGMFRSPQGRSVIFIHERDLPDSGQAPRAPEGLTVH